MAKTCRELVLQVPLYNGSRGRNGVFTVTSVRLETFTGQDAEEVGTMHGRPFVAITARSARSTTSHGRQPPIELGLSVEDAALLAKELGRAVQDAQTLEKLHRCPECGNPNTETILPSAVTVVCRNCKTSYPRFSEYRRCPGAGHGECYLKASGWYVVLEQRGTQVREIKCPTCAGEGSVLIAAQEPASAPR